MSKEYNKIPEVLRAASGARKKALTAGALIVHGATVLRCPVGKYPPGSGRVGGNLRSSYDWRATDEEAVVGTNVDYAPWVELGTSRMTAQPHLRPGLDNNIDNVLRAMADIYGAAIDGVVR